MNPITLREQPTQEEQDAACAAFRSCPPHEVQLTPLLPRLVMIRRAVRAGFFTDDLPDPLVEHRKQHGPGQVTCYECAWGKFSPLAAVRRP